MRVLLKNVSNDMPPERRSTNVSSVGRSPDDTGKLAQYRHPFARPGPLFVWLSGCEWSELLIRVMIRVA